MASRPPTPMPPGVRPDGSLAVERIGLERSFGSDLFHTLMTTSWPKLLGLLFATWIAFNAVFAVLYMLDPGGVANCRPWNFLDHFFFSVQTSATIGYGGMMPTDLYTHLLVVLEAFGSTIQVACITGVAVAKFARPTARVIWSENIVIQDRDGVPELSFRVGNQRANQIVEARVNVSITRDEVMSSGERFRRVVNLDLVRRETPAFVLTWTIMHRITPSSPLHGLTPADFEAGQVNFLVTLTGLDETLGQTVHARTMYPWTRVLWDHRHDDIFSLKPDGTRLIDYRKFHDVLPTTPRGDG